MQNSRQLKAEGVARTLLCVLCAQLLSCVRLSQARVLEWIAISYSRESSWPNRIHVSCSSCIGRGILYHWGFPSGSDGKESAWNTGDPGLIPGSGRSPGESNGNPLLYSCLENPMNRGGWWIIQSMGTFFITVPPGKPPELSHTSLYLILPRTLREEEHFQMRILRLLEFTQSRHLEAVAWPHSAFSSHSTILTAIVHLGIFSFNLSYF